MVPRNTTNSMPLANIGSLILVFPILF